MIKSVCEALRLDHLAMNEHIRALEKEGIEAHLKASLAGALAAAATDVGPILIAAGAAAISMDGAIRKKMGELLSQEVRCVLFFLRDFFLF